MQEIHDIIIIGGGPAGYTAALYAARGGLDTLVLERMSLGGQMTETGSIDNYPGFEDGIDGVELGMKMQASAERFGAKTELADVTRVELSGKIKRIFTDFGEYAARAVIIATGATPRPLGIDGEAELVGRGIHYCAHCDGRFYSDRTLVVVGGGNSAATPISISPSPTVLASRAPVTRPCELMISLTRRFRRSSIFPVRAIASR